MVSSTDDGSSVESREAGDVSTWDVEMASECEVAGTAVYLANYPDPQVREGGAI